MNRFLPIVVLLTAASIQAGEPSKRYQHSRDVRLTAAEMRDAGMKFGTLVTSGEIKADQDELYVTDDGGRTWMPAIPEKDGDAFLWSAPADGTYGFNIIDVKTTLVDPAASDNLRPLLYVVVDTSGRAEDAYDAGNRLLHEGRLDQAAAAFRAALEMDPQYADAHADLGLVLYEKREFASAAAEFEAANEVDPQAATMFDLALAREELRDHEKAWDAAKFALRWADRKSFLFERAADLAGAIASRLRDPKPAWREIAELAPETPAGREAAEHLRR